MIRIGSHHLRRGDCSLHGLSRGCKFSSHSYDLYSIYNQLLKRGTGLECICTDLQGLGVPTTMKQAVTETGDLVWQKDEDGNLKPQMKRNSYGGASGNDAKGVWLGAFLQRLQSERKSYLVGLPQGESGRDGEGRGTET